MSEGIQLGCRGYLSLCLSLSLAVLLGVLGVFQSISLVLLINSPGVFHPGERQHPAPHAKSGVSQSELMVCLDGKLRRVFSTARQTDRQARFRGVPFVEDEG